MIETVIFDLGNVLVDVRTDALQGDLSALLGLDEAATRARLATLMPLMEHYERGRLNGVEFYRQVLSRFELDQDRYPFSRYRQHWSGALVERPGMTRLFHQVCAARRTCILSNTNDLHWMYTAERFDLVQHAVASLTSYECGLFKPELAIYELALERFGVDDPGGALFIDDKPENVQAAVEAGMARSFVFRSEQDTRRRLQEEGVL